MKDGTENLTKFKLLQKDLSLCLWEVRGLLDSLWKFTRDNCPRGDLGKFTPEEICAMIEWNRTDTHTLFDALINRRWIDKDDECGYRVHDWPEHCELSVHRSIALKGLTFADGTEPNQSKMTKPERSRARKRREQLDAAAGGSLPSRAKPCLSKPSLAKPEPSPAAAGPDSGFSNSNRTDLTPESLADLALLKRWFDEESKRSDRWVSGSVNDWVFVKAVAAKVLGPGIIRDPVAVAKWIIGGGHRDYVNATHEELARHARRAAETSPRDPIVAALAAAFTLPDNRKEAS